MYGVQPMYQEKKAVVRKMHDVEKGSCMERRATWGERRELLGERLRGSRDRFKWQDHVTCHLRLRPRFGFIDSIGNRVRREWFHKLREAQPGGESQRRPP